MSHMTNFKSQVFYINKKSFFDPRKMNQIRGVDYQ